MTTFTRLRRQERGSALILALVFLSLFGLFIAVLLSFTSTSLRTTGAVRSQGMQVYAADGAVDSAINAIRTNASEGVQGACTNSYPTTLNGVAVRVECVGEAGSGQIVSTGGSTPQAAIITLSTNSALEQGFVLETQVAATVKGGVSSKTGIEVQNGAILTIPSPGKASAALACPTGSGTINGTTDCPTTGTLSSDPNYALPTLPTVEATLPTTCPAGNVVALEGNRKYTDYTKLQNLLTLSNIGCSGNPGRVFWFKPGIHYFNFPVGTPDGIYLQGTSVSKSVYVAGQPLNWDPTTDPTPASVAGIPNASKRCDTDASGSEFVFGDRARFGMKNGTFEICPPTAPGPRIAIYGVKANASGFTGLTGCVVAVPANCTGQVLGLLHPDASGGGGQALNFIVRGTVYAPTANLIVRLPSNQANETFDRGIIGRTVTLQHTSADNLASFSCGDQGCGAGAPANRKVTFTACPASATSPCPEIEKLLRATIEYDDANGTNPGQNVNVLSWSVLK